MAAVVVSADIAVSWIKFSWQAFLQMSLILLLHDSCKKRAAWFEFANTLRAHSKPQQSVCDVLSCFLFPTSPPVRVGAGCGLQPKIDRNSHPGNKKKRKKTCDQHFGIEHKGCSVLGKLLWKAHSYKLHIRIVSPRVERSFVTAEAEVQKYRCDSLCSQKHDSLFKSSLY